MKFNHPQQPILILYCTISVGGLIVLPDLAQAQVPSRLPRPAVIIRPARLPTLNPIGATTALQEGATVKIFPGRASVINFRTNEFITSITLSDPTYVLYTPNAEIDSGQTTALILRLSDGIVFENLTRSSRPNISITTINQEGKQKTYLFDLEIASGLPIPNRDHNGIVIVPDNQAIASNGNVIQTAKGDATMNDIERGLRISIRQGFTTRTDPIVAKVQEVLAQSRNGGSLMAIAQQVGVPLSVLTTLGELGLDAAGVN
ncbi:MAG: hypothetical protein LH679_07115 [Cyanobacteria bacterium CAN_BIN43]|nr:hypothetical protein [Cyanobacteria bacterium CAN_BIN43]